jgi:hypothetical protein
MSNRIGLPLVRREHSIHGPSGLVLLAPGALGVHDRIMTRLEVFLERFWLRQPAYRPIEWDHLVQGLEARLGAGLAGFLGEPALADIEQAAHEGIRELAPRAPFPVVHNADLGLARLCYGICRAVKPSVVVETGVAYGVTSAFILKAMQVNGHGALHSVDRPPLGYRADSFVGFLVPDALRPRWHLHQGLSRRVLPSLLAQLQRVDVFLHDSRHTYRNMDWELRAVTPFLAHTSAVIADDVDRNVAFEYWVRERHPSFHATMRETDKGRLLGVGLFVDPGAPRA